jgi:tetratricopeptide (TPR) repeat protein
MADSIRDQVAAEATGRGKVDVLNRHFFHEWGFQGDAALDSPDSLLPDRVLERRRGYCVGLATVYLALARELDLPIHAVAAPAHMFARYDDGSERLNIELLGAGAGPEDAWYARQYAIPEASIDRGVFLRDLTDREALGYVYANLGTLDSRAGDFTRSRALYEAALAADRRLPSAHYNLGNDLLRQHLYRQAIRRFNRSLRLNPADAWALNNRGLAYCGLGRTARALEDFHAAVALDASFTQAARNLSRGGCGPEAATAP